MNKLILAIIFTILVIFACEANQYYLKCEYAGDNLKRCENSEVICYIYDSGWAGVLKSGRGAGISCIKKENK